MISTQLRTISRWLTLMAICALFAGCIGKKSPEVAYYSLLSMEQLDDSLTLGQGGADLRLGIGPVTVPDSLKRTQLATRSTQNAYQFDEYNRWAGILEKDIAYILGENLGDLLGTEKIAFFPWMHHFTPTHRVAIDIIQFDGMLTGEAILSVRWSVADAEGKINLAGGKGVYRQPVEDGSYAGLVKAESLALAAFSRDLAEKLFLLAQQLNTTVTESRN